MFDWFFASVDLTRPHAVGPMLSWHARLMVMAWGVLVPIGVLLARYFKIWPGQDWPRALDDQRWWFGHRACQYLATVLSVVALGLILWADRQAVLGGWHALLGWSVLVLMAVQILGGLLRGTKGGPTDATLRGDHYDMTTRRLWFEYIHKIAGYMVILLAVAAIMTGLWQSNAPNWMVLVMAIWWGVLGGAVVVLQGAGRAVDTYQAIWGPDPKLPGNKRKPIGFGVSQESRPPKTDP